MSKYEPFEGVIGRTLAESTPWWPAEPDPGANAPNVVVMLFDDLGFSHFGCYGSTIDTPNIDRLAANGLRYTNFHVTPLCSPTRAALLTGRNHHEVGMRSVSNFNTGFPHMRGRISHHAATMGEVLRDSGYATFAVGKWHLCPMEHASAAGPFDHWPCQRGFDRFYGFLDGETDQFHPELVIDNHHISTPLGSHRPAASPEGAHVAPGGQEVDPPNQPGYHLSEDLVDQALRMIHDTKSIRPDKPFFTYLAFGATHAPHQAPPEYLAKYRGKFDQGWDATRDEWFARQKELGVIPPETELAPRNPGVEAWDSLSENQRKLAARLQEAFAAFLDHTDAQIGRFVAGLERLGELDNTIIVLLSDNGASQEGGPFGVLNEWKFFNFILEDADEAVNRLDDIGGPNSHTNYPWGWSQVGNTPFKWYKQNTHEGGVHVPCVIQWPARISDRGGLRHQFHHVNDIAPTIYEAIGVDTPAVYRGYEQMPVTGTSMLATFDAAPDAPSAKTVQYFEMMGHRGIYADGWKAVTRHIPGVAFDDDPWELYHVEVDRSECHDLAAEMPDKLAEMIGLWWREAEAHGVLPLDERTITLFGARFRERSPHLPSRHYTYVPPITPMPAQVGPGIGGRSWDMDVQIERAGGENGVLYATGTASSGISLFVENEHLVLDYNEFGVHHVVESKRTVPTGASIVGVRFRRTGRNGFADLVIDGDACGHLDVPFVMNIISSIGPSVGYDHGSPVSTRYADSFPFAGTVHRVDIQLVSDRPAEVATTAAAAERAENARQ